MAGSPRVVNETCVIPWDHVEHRLTKGQVIDVPPGSALEAAIGAHRLDPMFQGGPAAAPAPATAGSDTETADDDGQTAARKTARPAKTEKDGDA